MTIVLCQFFPFYATFYLYGADLWVFILSEGNERTANEPCLAENERLKLSLVKLIKGRFLAANGEPRVYLLQNQFAQPCDNSIKDSVPFLDSTLLSAPH